MVSGKNRDYGSKKDRGAHFSGKGKGKPHGGEGLWRALTDKKGGEEDDGNPGKRCEQNSRRLGRPCRCRELRQKGSQVRGRCQGCRRQVIHIDWKPNVLPRSVAMGSWQNPSSKEVIYRLTLAVVMRKDGREVERGRRQAAQVRGYCTGPGERW